jgi:hypothetical protein
MEYIVRKPLRSYPKWNLSLVAVVVQIAIPEKGALRRLLPVTEVGLEVREGLRSVSMPSASW